MGFIQKAKDAGGEVLAGGTGEADSMTYHLPLFSWSYR
jgi:hypothetical protein